MKLRGAFVVAVAAIALGCTSSASPGADDAAAAGDGAAGDGAAGDSATAPSDGGAAACVHDPAASSPIPATASDTLPEGACSASQAACDLVVRKTCSCPSEGPSIRVYFHCACTSSTWQCTETDTDSAVCTQRGDPGCDAGLDGD